MEHEEEPRNTRETPQSTAGYGSAGASPYRQGGGHGRAWIMGLFRGNHDILAADGTRMEPGRMRRPSGRRDADRCGRDARAPLSRAGAGSYGRSQRVISRVERVDGWDAEGRRG